MLSEMPATAAIEVIALPKPRLKGGMSLEEAIAARRSKRGYRGEPLRLNDTAQLLWAAQGITGPEDKRAAPSAGALFPLELYLSVTKVEGIPPGVYKYDPAAHSLTLHRDGDRRRELTAAAMDQDCVRFSAGVLIFTAVASRTVGKYGERGRRYIDMEAAHASENVYLQAAALGLGTVAVGAFDPAAVTKCLELPRAHKPVYLMPVGRV